MLTAKVARSTGAPVIERLNALAASAGATAALVLVGVAARAYAYAADRSLWHDEAAIALNVVGRSFAQLASPLRYTQVAPLGFLWLEKLASAVLGTSEAALRLVPFLASIAALILFALVARRMLGGVASALAVGLFAVSPPLLYYAQEVKQYSLDTAVAALVLLLALRWRDRELGTARALALGLVGASVCWFSQPAAFALCGAGLYVLHGVSARRRQWRRLLVATLITVVGAGLALLHSVRGYGPAERAYLATFWTPAFMPVAEGLGATFRWLASTAADECRWFVVWPLPAFLLLFLVLGITEIARRRSGELALLAIPTIAGLVASASRVYPFSARLTLYVAPALFLFVGAGFAFLVRHAPSTRRATAVVDVLGLVIFVTAARSLRDLPARREELRPVVRWVAAQRRPGDIVYVYYGGALAFRYYADREGILSTDYIVGSCSRQDWKGYLDDLRPLRGHDRAWLILAHPFKGRGIREDSLFTQYLSAAGRRRAEFRDHGALAQLYDLSDTARFDSAAPRLVPFASGDTTGARETCAGFGT